MAAEPDSDFEPDSSSEDERGSSEDDAFDDTEHDEDTHGSGSSPASSSRAPSRALYIPPVRGRTHALAGTRVCVRIDTVGGCGPAISRGLVLCRTYDANEGTQYWRVAWDDGTFSTLPLQGFGACTWWREEQQ